MRHFILTDLEGVAGIDSWENVRTEDEEQKAAAMDQLAREVDACVEGIRSVDPDAEIDVWDGHGPGGLRADDVENATYLREGHPYYDLEGFDAMYFVGQHAMAGTAYAPLRHTYISRAVDYYKLDGTFVGEFGCRALVAGEQGVPTVFLSGDDKACHEAEMFVPEIETVAVKRGLGDEAAEHMDRDAAVDAVREGAARAAKRTGEIPLPAGFEPPHELVIRYYDPVDDDRIGEHAEPIDSRTVRISGENLADPSDPVVQRF
jgi:D-amino peptidase